MKYKVSKVRGWNNCLKDKTIPYTTGISTYANNPGHTHANIMLIGYR